MPGSCVWVQVRISKPAKLRSYKTPLVNMNTVWKPSQTRVCTAQHVPQSYIEIHLNAVKIAGFSLLALTFMVQIQPLRRPYQMFVCRPWVFENTSVGVVSKYFLSRAVWVSLFLTSLFFSSLCSSPLSSFCHFPVLFWFTFPLIIIFFPFYFDLSFYANL